MGKDKQEETARKAPKRPTEGANTASRRSARLWTFKPTAEQRDKWLKIPPDDGTIAVAIEELLQRGVSITQFYDGDKGAYCLICRERGGNWDTAPAFSVWHSDLNRCYQAVWLYITHVNTEFPYQFQPTLFYADDW